MNHSHSMRQFLVLLIISCLAIQVSAQKSSAKKGLQVITSEKLQKHIDYLASDALMGRNTPSAGLDSAASYIAREFKKYGVQPVKGTYFNPLPLTIRALGTDNHLEVIHNGQTKALKIKTDFVPFEITANAEVSGSLVFAGYGITATEYNYDDYKGLDVKGKIVVVLRHEPGEDDTASVFNGKTNTKHSFNEAKAENAIAHGAVGMLVITDPLNHQMIMPRGFPWPSLSKILPRDALPMVLVDSSKRIPVVHVGKEIVNLLFGDIDSLKNIQMAMDKNMTPASVEFPSITVRLKTSIDETQIKTNNVIGYIPGVDPVLKNEYLVVGAHYDHVGFLKEYAEGADYINNGADDNASGTAGVLAVAEAFSKMKAKPKRSVVFMAFSGEEKGLLGSEAYVRNPLFPLDKTVAMLNLDMISRNNIDSVFLEGANVSPGLADIVRKENKSIGFIIDIDDKFVGGSDHASFYKKNVPFVFFFSGLHNDYHTVRDNPNTINSKKAARVSQLVFKTAWFVANDNQKYKLLEKAK